MTCSKYSYRLGPRAVYVFDEYGLLTNVKREL